MAEKNTEAQVKANEDAVVGTEGRQVKPTDQKSAAEVKDSILVEADKDIYPSSLEPADATSIPGPKYPPQERPPVSTTKPDEPVITSLVTGAGAHEPPDPKQYDAAGRPRD